MSVVDEWSVVKAGLSGVNESLPVPRRKTDKAPPMVYSDLWRNADEVCGEVRDCMRI